MLTLHWILVFSIRTTHNTDIKIHPDWTTVFSFVTYVPSNPNLIMESSFETDTLANLTLI